MPYFMASFCPTSIAFFSFLILVLQFNPSNSNPNSISNSCSKELLPITKLLHRYNQFTMKYHCHHGTNTVIALTIDNLSRNGSEDLIDFGELVGMVCHLHHLTNLTINLFYSSYGGSIPLCLGDLKNISLLHLPQNGLKGAIPEFLSMLTHLTSLDLSDNRLTGSIPESLSMLTHLTSLDLSINSLTGSIPESLSMLTHLTSLYLAYNSLTGSIPESLSMLTHLTSLDLAYNSLTRLLPKSFQRLNRLILMDLSYNNELIGNISSSLLPYSLQHLDVSKTSVLCDDVQGFHYLNYLAISKMSNNYTFCNLTSLKTLSLESDDILNASILSRMLACNTSLHNLKRLEIYVGSIEYPAALVPSFSTLNNLQKLFLMTDHCSRCEEHPLPLSSLCILPKLLEVTIMNVWMESNSVSNCSFNSLQYLSLYENNMSGLLPALHAPQLTQLYVSGNEFFGPIPEQWRNCTRLSDLSLSSMALKEIPNWFFRLPIEILSLASCELRSIPCPHLSLLNKTLSYLSMPGNNLTHDILHCLESVPFQLFVLELSSNPLNATIPSNISLISTQVDRINLSMCGLYGNLPPSLFSFQEIVSLDLSLNSLSGEIPSVIWNITIAILDLSSNNFSSITTPPTILPKTSSSEIIRLSNNIIDTNFFNWFTLAFPNACDSLIMLDISNNSFNGNIPQTLCNCSRLTYLFLQDNRLIGKIPTQIGQLEHLTMLSLRNNTLNGSIPSNILNCTLMELLDVSDNQIGGMLVHSPIQHLLNLRVMVLASNQFHGKIPEWIGTFSSHLQFLDMSHNYLSGTIPNNLTLHAFRFPKSNLSKLRPSLFEEYTYKMHLLQHSEKGLLLNYTYVLDTLECLDLSYNNLSGEIPSQLGDLIGMHSLQLSHNSFVGNIPASISHLMCLESLDLSWNELNGSIPIGLGNISFLEYLRLGHNHLTGMIPSGTQLQGFSTDSYLPNDGLCGPPLHNDCNNHTTSNISSHIKDTKQTTLTLLRNSIIFSVFTGYLIGFWVVSIIMFFLRRRFKLELCMLIRE